MPPLLPRYRPELGAEQARILAAVLLETGCSLDELRADPRAAAGDPDRLRGWPAVGVRGGRGGAISGSRPEDCIDRIDRERRQRL